MSDRTIPNREISLARNFRRLSRSDPTPEHGGNLGITGRARENPECEFVVRVIERRSSLKR